MNILFVCKSLPATYKGGIQTHVWSLSGQLLKAGNQVSILTAGFSGKGMVEGRQIISVPYLPGRFFPLAPAITEELSFNLSIKKWLKRHAGDFDLIHLQGRSGYWYPLKRGSNPVPCVMTIHRLSSIEKRWGREELTGLDRWFYYPLTDLLERRALRRADALIAISQEAANEALEVLGQAQPSPHLIYNGIDVLPDPLPVPDFKQLLFVGRLTKVKGVIPLIEAMAWVRPDIRLAIIGDGPAGASVKDLIQKSRLGHRVRLLGSLPHAEVLQWIKQSLALILPSYHESLGLVLQESLSCGRPVLASQVEGITEIVIDGKNGLFFPAGQPKAIAAKINELFENPQRALRLGNWGRRHLGTRFPLEATTGQTVEIYKSLL